MVHSNKFNIWNIMRYLFVNYLIINIIWGPEWINNSTYLHGWGLISCISIFNDNNNTLMSDHIHHFMITIIHLLSKGLQSSVSN